MTRQTLPSPALLAALLLTGCQLFKSAAIDVSCDELADCVPAEADTDTDTDADSDTDTDTEPPFTAADGLLVSSASATRGILSFLAAPELEVELEVDADASFAGPTTWSTPTARAWLATADTLIEIDPETDAVRTWPLGIDLVDISASEEGLWLADSTMVYSFDPDLGQALPIAEESWWTEITRLEPDPDGGIWILDGGSTTDFPDLLRYDPSNGALGAIWEDFDASMTHSEGGLFAGPSGDPCVCAANGDIFTISELRAAYVGGRAPSAEAIPDLGLTDVVACSYDEGLDGWIIATAENGLWVFTADSPPRSALLASDGSQVLDVGVRPTP